MNKKAAQIIPGIILYIFAVLMAIYTIWSYTYCADIVSQAKETGQLAASGNGYTIVSFYVSNCGLYLVFTLLLAAAGLMLQRTPASQTKPDTTIDQADDEADDKELDDWFDEVEERHDE